VNVKTTKKWIADCMTNTECQTGKTNTHFLIQKINAEYSVRRDIRIQKQHKYRNNYKNHTGHH